MGEDAGWSIHSWIDGDTEMNEIVSLGFLSHGNSMTFMTKDLNFKQANFEIDFKII